MAGRHPRLDGRRMDRIVGGAPAAASDSTRPAAQGRTETVGLPRCCHACAAAQEVALPRRRPASRGGHASAARAQRGGRARALALADGCPQGHRVRSLGIDRGASGCGASLRQAAEEQAHGLRRPEMESRRRRAGMRAVPDDTADEVGRSRNDDARSRDGPLSRFQPSTWITRLASVSPRIRSALSAVRDIRGRIPIRASVPSSHR